MSGLEFDISRRDDLRAKPGPATLLLFAASSFLFAAALMFEAHPSAMTEPGRNRAIGRALEPTPTGQTTRRQVEDSVQGPPPSTEWRFHAPWGSVLVLVEQEPLVRSAPSADDQTFSTGKNDERPGQGQTNAGQAKQLPENTGPRTYKCGGELKLPENWMKVTKNPEECDEFNPDKGLTKALNLLVQCRLGVKKDAEWGARGEQELMALKKAHPLRKCFESKGKILSVRAGCIETVLGKDRDDYCQPEALQAMREDEAKTPSITLALKYLFPVESPKSLSPRNGNPKRIPQ